MTIESVPVRHNVRAGRDYSLGSAKLGPFAGNVDPDLDLRLRLPLWVTKTWRREGPDRLLNRLAAHAGCGRSHELHPQVGHTIIPTSPLPVTSLFSSFDRRLNAVRSIPATATSIFMHQLRFGVVLWPICKLITPQRRYPDSLLYGGSYSPCTSIRSAFIHDHSEAHDDGVTLPCAGHLHCF